MAATPDIEVDDIVSEVLLRAYATPDFERIDRGEPFLFTIARNLVADLARHRSVVPFDMMLNIDRLELADGTATPESTTLARDELRRLQEVVGSLPEQARQVFILRRIEERSLSDIAARLGLSVSTVEKHLSKAMRLITAAMAEQAPVAKPQRGWTWRPAKNKR